MMLYLNLFYVFFKIGVLGFGGGYTMMSMIMTEAAKFSVTPQQVADLTALDMIVPGPIAINSATYVGYLSGGFLGALCATVGLILPSIAIVLFVMKFIVSYRKNKIMSDFLSGVKPAAVGLIAAAATTIALSVLFYPDADFALLFSRPFESLSLLAVASFVVTAVANIKFKVNPILLTIAAGVVGAILSL